MLGRGPPLKKRIRAWFCNGLVVMTNVWSAAPCKLVRRKQFREGARASQQWRCWFPSSLRATPLLFVLQMSLGHCLDWGRTWRRPTLCHSQCLPRSRACQASFRDQSRHLRQPYRWMVINDGTLKVGTPGQFVHRSETAPRLCISV